MLRSRLASVIRQGLGSRACSGQATGSAPVEPEKPAKTIGEALDKITQDAAKAMAPPAEKPPTFASLLRNSNYIKLGHPEGKVVYGRIYYDVEDDLYIDFGGKFDAICKRPVKDPHLYTRGSFVRIRLLDLELASQFLGADRELSLLEADATLLGHVDASRQPPRDHRVDFNLA